MMFQHVKSTCCNCTVKNIESIIAYNMMSTYIIFHVLYKRSTIPGINRSLSLALPGMFVYGKASVSVDNAVDNSWKITG